MGEREEEEGSSADVAAVLRRKIREGDAWLTSCEKNLRHVSGVQKLAKKLKAELNFLKKLQAAESVRKLEQIHCSNLLHLTSIVRSASGAADLAAVLQPFHYPCPESGSSSKVVVDVVSDSGRRWTKVVARNPHSMRQISIGQGQFGERSILDHARNLMSCARANTVCYVAPAVCISFYNGVTHEVANALRDIGVDVDAKCLEECGATENIRANETVSPDVVSTSSPPSQRHIIEDTKITRLNLDVSTMLAYVSALTNGGAHFKFNVPVLSQQAANERLNPVKPVLDALFYGRTLLCCETALKDFENILTHIAGENEKERGRRLLDLVERIPDGVSPSVSSLKLRGKIRQRSLKIFGTGEALQAVTVTANVGFVRAAESQGVSIPVFVHESRALSEAKECANDGD